MRQNEREKEFRLSISLFLLQDIKISHFLSQNIAICHLLLRMSQKSQHTRFEDKIPGQVSFGGFPATCASLTHGLKCEHRA